MAEEKDGKLKSSFELAMERLRKGDADSGVERRPVSDTQKAAIAEIRNYYEAKIAELEVLHRSSIVRSMDHAELEALDQNYRHERERLSAERESKIEKIRRGE